ncbi:transmembrane protein 17-like [Anopheles aquasalis]|uniref:transmembrane protein 17-like n=1 Tax=Anopheles aquasalis TaxID=42839 RepID=UPI00215B05D4|nr:transmembrane protein 17-like [Anopheles aquasalis]
METVKGKIKSVYEEEEVISDLWVQLMIHINIYFAPVWLVAAVVCLYYEFENINSIEQTLSILTLIVSAPLEVARLYLGYTGNLKSTIPSFAGFLILSFLIQLPLQTYLLIASHTHQHVLAVIVQSIATGTLVLQIVLGVPAMRKLSDFRRAQFQQQRWQYIDKRSQFLRNINSKPYDVAC